MAVLFSVARDPLALPRSSLRILGSMIPHMWMINVHKKFLYSKVVIYRVVISFTSSIANVSTMLCFYGYHYDITFIGPSKLFC